MAADRLTRAVRHQLGLGRLLPLGEAEDGAWIAERAAVAVLSAEAATVRGVRLESLRIDLAEPDTTARPWVQPPPSGLPPGPLRLEAAIATSADEPLPEAAERLRGTLARAAGERLGPTPASVDVRITELYDGPGAAPGTAAAGRGAARPEAPEPSGPSPGPSPDAPSDAPPSPAAAAARAAAAVPGVARLAPALSASAGGAGVRGVQVTDRTGANGGPAAGRHFLVQIAVDGTHRALDVARAVRAAVVGTAAATADAPGPVTVAVLITAIDGAREDPGTMP